MRNRADGSVEAVVQGPSEAVREVIMLTHQGSPAARVAHVALSDDTLAGFSQRDTV